MTDFFFDAALIIIAAIGSIGVPVAPFAAVVFVVVWLAYRRYLRRRRASRRLAFVGTITRSVPKPGEENS